MNHYATAQICRNGHCITPNLESHRECASNNCSECGASTISECLKCNEKIRGRHQLDGIVVAERYKVPFYCHNCGAPYPWTESVLESTALLIQEDDTLSDQVKMDLQECLPDVIIETPRTNLAAIRFKKAMAAVGKLTAEGLRQFVIDFGCELALKSMGFK